MTKSIRGLPRRRLKYAGKGAVPSVTKRLRNGNDVIIILSQEKGCDLFELLYSLPVRVLHENIMRQLIEQCDELCLINRGYDKID